MSKTEGYTPHPFDAENGVQTSGLIPGRYLKSGHKHDRHSTAYFGVSPSVFRALLRRWKRTNPAARVKDFAFIDVGAGMGRAMLLAGEHSFRQVIGIELNPILARAAQRNLAIWKEAGRVRVPMQIVCGDALDAGFPDGPCLVFFFNPFGASVMRRLLKRLAGCLCRSSGQARYSLRQQRAGAGDRAPGADSRGSSMVGSGVHRADAIADHRIMANQPDGEYAAANYEDCSIWRWDGWRLSHRKG